MKRILFYTFLAAGTVGAAQPINAPLTLDEALTLADRQSKVAVLGRLNVEIADAELDAARRLRYPEIRARGAALHLNDPMEVTVGRGSLTTTLNETAAELGIGPIGIDQFPTNDLSLARGSHNPRFGALTVAQPLTQLWQIGSGVRAAQAGLEEAQRESEHIDSKVRFAVEELFVGLLVQSRRTREKEATLVWEERRLRDAETAQQSGELLDESVLGIRAAVIDAHAELTRSRQTYGRLSLQLADLIGRSGADDLVVVESLPLREDQPLESWTAQAINNPEYRVAAATVGKTGAGVRAARQAYIPEVSLVGGASRQHGIPTVEETNGLVGLTLNWDVFDFGRRRADVSRAAARHRAAAVNRDRLQEDATREIRLAHQDLVFADEQIALTRQAVAFRRRAAELAHQSAANGLALEADALEADAELRKAEADLTGATYQRHLALLHLHFLAGRL